jgi:hypothetical protein
MMEITSMNRDVIEIGGYYEVDYEGKRFVVEAMWPSLTFDDAWLVSRVDNGRTFVLATKYFVRPAGVRPSRSRHARHAGRYTEAA